jgi:hypothetical protein
MPLSEIQRVNVRKVLANATDVFVSQPLWAFHPFYRPLVLTERARRQLLQNDPEPSGDPEFS